MGKRHLTPRSAAPILAALDAQLESWIRLLRDMLAREATHHWRPEPQEIGSHVQGWIHGAVSLATRLAPAVEDEIIRHGQTAEAECNRLAAIGEAWAAACWSPRRRF